MGAGAAPERARWLGPPNDGTARRAVALLIHGLNLRPTRMLQIANMLSAEGVECLNLALSGHGSPDDAARAERDMREGASLESFKSVSHSQWLAEARAAHALARIRAEDLGVPLILVGFSLGATLGAELANQPGPAPRFDGMIFFAPAFRVHWYTRLLRLLWPFPRLTLKSFSPSQYATNPATPIAAYNALFRSMAALPDRPEQQRVTNALIFIDPKDELVSYRALRTLCESQASSSWRLVETPKQLRKGERDYHHLIIDEASLGSEGWGDVVRQVESFLGALRKDPCKLTTCQGCCRSLATPERRADLIDTAPAALS